MHWAARQKNEYFINYLLNSDTKKMVNCRNHNGFTPLHFACAKVNVRAAEALLIAGACPNSPNIYDATPLHWLFSASCKDKNQAANKIELFKLIILAMDEEMLYNNFLKKNKIGYTPLHWVIITEDNLLFNELIEFSPARRAILMLGDSFYSFLASRKAHFRNGALTEMKKTIKTLK